MKNQSVLMRIGHLSKESGTSIDAIRFYEKQGLLKRPSRTEGGFRLYPKEAVDQLVFVQKAQKFGLTLKEIKEIMCCGDKGLEPCCDLTVNLFSKKIKEFEAKVKELNHMKRKLKTVLGGWVEKKAKK